MSNEPESTSKPSRRPAVLGFLVWSVARLLGSTLRIRYEGFERIAEFTASGNGAILVAWHGRTLVPANVFRKRGYWALISLSRDGEVQNHIFRRFGFQTVRGSTGRGGVRAVLQLAKIAQKGGVLAFTPDGPRGPTHEVQPGTVFLAQRSGCPVVPLGVSARPRKLLPTWDRYMLPAPFARVAFIVGEPIYVPADADAEGVSDVTLRIKQALDRCEERAEEMVGLRPARGGV